MSETPQKPVDPFAIWQEMVSEFETHANTTLNTAMGSDEFAQFMGKATGLSLGPQNAVGNMMSRYLAALNLPSRTDIAALGERLQAIEGTLDRLTDAIEQSGSIWAQSQSSEVLVSRVVTDLVAGAGLKFSARGSHELKGLPGRWELFAASLEGPPMSPPGT